MMAAGKTCGYRHNIRLETILSQVPKNICIFKEKVQRLNGSGLCEKSLRYSPVPLVRVFLINNYIFHKIYV